MLPTLRSRSAPLRGLTASTPTPRASRIGSCRRCRVNNRCSHAANWTYDACVGAAGRRCAARGHRYAGEAEGKIPEGNKPAEVVLFSLTEAS